MSSKVALIETKPSRNNYESLFDNAIEFERMSLTEDASLVKVLKKDVTLKIDLNSYDWVILVGSEPLKYFTKITSITEYNGKLVDDKFLPVINPAMLKFKPEAKKDWQEAKENIIGYVTGTLEATVISNEDFVGIDDTEIALKYLKYVLEAPHGYIGLDTETTGFYPRNGDILGISISGEPDKGAYILSDCIDDRCEDLLQEIFNKKLVVFWNAKFDVAMLEYHFNFKFPNYGDGMLIHYMLDETPGTHSLKQVALKYTKYGDYEKPLEDWKSKYCRENKIKQADFNYGLIPFDIMKTYAALDAAVTFILYEFLQSYLVQNKKLTSVYENILLPASRFLTDIQDNGVPFDRDRLDAARELMTEDIRKDVEELNSYTEVRQFITVNGEFNPNSVIQLRKLLFDYLNLSPTGIKTEKGEHSTNAEVLEILSTYHEVPKLILRIRQKGKIKNTYLDKIIPQLDSDSHLRTNFNLHVTTSGRLSSSGKLNMQQIPRDNPIVKGCIKARKGWKIVGIDLGTAEMYYAAVLSGDKELQSVFSSGGDFHSTIAHKVFNLPCEISKVATLYPAERQAAKAISFGILYGAGPHKISQEVTSGGGSLSFSEANEVINDYFRAFPNLKKWIDSNIDFMKANYFAYSFFGRKRRLPDIKSDNKGTSGHMVRSGLNFLVQSPASDCNLLGAIDANKELQELNMKAQIFALVHDSILAEVPDEEVEEYSNIIVRNLQLDRGISIPGSPIRCDIEVGEDYSFGKFEKAYATIN